MSSIALNGNAAQAPLRDQQPGTAAKIKDDVAEVAKQFFAKFLREYTEDASGEPTTTDEPLEALYIQKIIAMAEDVDHTPTTLFIDLQHLESYHDQLAAAIVSEYYRMEPYMNDALLEAIYEYAPKHPKLYSSPTQNIKAEYNCFSVSVHHLPKTDGLRACKTENLGRLMAITGTVTRTSQVRPELQAGTFVCMDCRTLNRGVKQQFKYTEPLTCLNPICENRTRWELEMRQSHFIDWQSLRIQENSDEIPPGSMPRTMKVILRNQIVDEAKPGDKCSFTGTLVVVPDVRQLEGGRSSGKMSRQDRQAAQQQQGQGVTGIKELGVRDLTYSLVFIANHVEATNSITGTEKHSELPSFLGGEENIEHDRQLANSMFTQEEQTRIREMAQQPKLYHRLIKSLAPNICGHDDIKRGILLMMLGGVHKASKVDKTKLRGDINICLVGDPSVSKSQFLKYVHSFMPRTVYTSGKASSAAGLTATVVKDAETGEFAIEAGALMLADNGICCIDEFDKMDINDQVAIHEAMEQQTISISKAGIQATLNARTSILAAANPIYGRYDRSKTLKQNVDISAPIMSRFDLFFVVLDDNSNMADFRVARHILGVHTGQQQQRVTEYSREELQNYIRFARMHRPRLSAAAKKYFVDNYVALRSNDSAGSASRSAYRITVRQLESMIRLAEARARLSLSDMVEPEHVIEAARLLKKSIVHVESEDVALEDEWEPPTAATHNDDSMKDDVEEEKTGEPQQQQNGPKKKIELPFVEYKRLSNLLVMYLRQQEQRQQKLGVKQIDIINWYVQQKVEQENITDVESLTTITKTIRLIIQRLLKIDHVLLELKQRPKPATDGDRLLYVHPNYNVEDSDTRGLADESQQENQPAAANQPLQRRGSSTVPQSASKAPKRSRSQMMTDDSPAVQEESKQQDSTDEVTSVLSQHRRGRAEEQQ